MSYLQTHFISAKQLQAHLAYRPRHVARAAVELALAASRGSDRERAAFSAFCDAWCELHGVARDQAAEHLTSFVDRQYPD